MAAEYDFRKNPKNSESDEPAILHPRIVSKGTVDTEKIVSDLSYSSTFTPGDIEGLLVSLEDQIAGYLKEGYEVKLGNIGYFSVRLKSRPVKDKKEIRSSSVSFDNVNFRATASFKKKAKGDLVRSSTGFGSSSSITDEECRQRLKAYLEDHSFITCNEYCRITGFLKSKALRNLKGLVADKCLIKSGMGTHVVYMKGEGL